MVLWSYLLLGLPVSASLDRVLAPLDAAPAATTADPKPAGARPETPAMPQLAAAFDELDLVAELERQLDERLQPAGRLHLIPLSRVPGIEGLSAVPTLTLIDHPSRLTSSSTVLRFQVADEERSYGPFAVSFRVQILADVWVSRRRLSPGEAMDPADFATREADLVREPKAVPADAQIFGRYAIARTVATERPLQWNDLAPRELVQKGGIVDVVAQDGGLSISMKGLATRGGALGESITIRNLESKREFAAEVIDENRVRVHF